ncbi:cyclase family protein [Thermomonospora curvata]|uniref:Cyclase family protein n=1 Tax=Thermomonospora curvata (strain ATCC 19995 / DSM 43183 / JCM 3096 / KCTC 9072 / NBRC 15933 / NCIMB 10081 / Henssen B9) TaxID=471852 RepID=D1AAJ0_THECD|nr:cyclase family protein [Thermomonospora curvata]ACY98903.1 cyclase family protein [Thermomonospora curvata DSM 43183]
MTWVDLSVPVVTGMPVYPGDPEVEVAPALTVAEAGVNVARVHLGSHAGTHVDAPCHVDDSWPRLDELPLDRFAGRAVPMDVRGLPPRTPIGPEHLPEGLRPGVVLLVVTGWSRHWGTPDYLAHPYLAAETCVRIAAAGVRTVGIDALSVDRTPARGEQDFSLAAHRALLEPGGVIAENLTGLDRLVQAPAEAEVFLFPVRLTGDGAPVRAVARLRS